MSNSLSADAVDALNKIIAHAKLWGGVFSLSAMTETSWSATYRAHELDIFTMHEELDEVIIELAKAAGLV